MIGRAAWLAALLVLPAGCVPSLRLDGAAPPCATGYHPCPLENTCAADGQLCPAALNCPLPPSAARILEVGNTDAENPTPNFVDLDGAGTMPLFYGTQGGYHVMPQLKILGVDPGGGITLTYTLFDPASSTGNATPLRAPQTQSLALYCSGDAYYLLIDPPRLYMCPSLTPGESMHDRDLVLHVEVTDRTGVSLTATPTIHPVCPAGDSNCTTSTRSGCAAP